MSASRPPPFGAAPPKRPWYLMAALVAVWIYGSTLLGGGYEVIAFFRGDRPDIHERTDIIASPEAREAAFAAGEQLLAVEESAKKREMPFGVASLLLGGAMVLLAARSIAGREGSRSALVQVVVVHVAVMVGAFLVLRDVALAEAAFQTRLAEGLNPALMHRLADPVELHRSEMLSPAVALFMHGGFCALVILALTRARARAFFTQAAPGPLGDA